MFPLVHFFINKSIEQRTTPLLTLGGMWPDLSAYCNMDRNISHYMGEKFLDFCVREHPETIDFALGILYHGSTPAGVDYYADEYWSGCKKGWCFQTGEKYMPEIARVTRLADDFIWWKSHNFVEMALELVTIEKYPQMNQEILSISNDWVAQELAVDALHQFFPIDRDKAIDIFHNIATTFTLKEVSAKSLAENNMLGMKRRFGIDNLDINEIMAVINRIYEDIKGDYDWLMAEIMRQMQANKVL